MQAELKKNTRKFKKKVEEIKIVEEEKERTALDIEANQSLE